MTRLFLNILCHLFSVYLSLSSLSPTHFLTLLAYYTAGSMYRYGVRLSVRLSVCPILLRSRGVLRVCSLVLWAWRAGDIDRQQHRSTGHSTAFSGKCEQCHVNSRRRRLNTDLFIPDLLYSPHALHILPVLEFLSSQDCCDTQGHGRSKWICVNPLLFI